MKYSTPFGDFEYGKWYNKGTNHDIRFMHKGGHYTHYLICQQNNSNDHVLIIAGNNRLYHRNVSTLKAIVKLLEA